MEKEAKKVKAKCIVGLSINVEEGVLSFNKGSVYMIDEAMLKDNLDVFVRCKDDAHISKAKKRKTQKKK